MTDGYPATLRYTPTRAHALTLTPTLNRKPEPGIYLLACERNGIKPSEAVFLDDLGM